MFFEYDKNNEMINLDDHPTCSCGGVGEFGVPGKRKQLGVVPYAAHAFITVGIG